MSCKGQKKREFKDLKNKGFPLAKINCGLTIDLAKPTASRKHQKTELGTH